MEDKEVFDALMTHLRHYKSDRKDLALSLDEHIQEIDFSDYVEKWDLEEVKQQVNDLDLKVTKLINMLSEVSNLREE